MLEVDEGGPLPVGLGLTSQRSLKDKRAEGYPSERPRCAGCQLLSARRGRGLT